MLYNWIIENKEILKIFYALIIIFICAIIVYRTDKLFRLSSYQGIRYFRNAFFFYGLAFIVRYFIGVSFNHILVKIFFEFFIIMAGFFLLYSLIWKKFNIQKSSLFSPVISLFYLMTILIVFLDCTWNTNYFMLGSQIILFTIASIISFTNYINKGNKHKFLKFYFLAMLLNLIAWILNTFAILFLNWNQNLLINIYGINIIIFLLFLFGVIKLTR